MKKICLIISLIVLGAYFSGCASTRNVTPKKWFSSEKKREEFNYALTKAFEEWRVRVRAQNQVIKAEWEAAEVAREAAEAAEAAREAAEAARIANATPPAGATPPASKEPEDKGEVIATFQVEDDPSKLKHFGKVFAETFYCLEVTLDNRYDKPVKIDSGAVRLPIFRISKMIPYNAGSGDQVLKDTSRPEEWFSFEFQGKHYKVETQEHKAMNFTSILGIIRYDQYHNKSSIIVRMLRTTGVIVGAVAPFVTAEDFGNWSSFFQGPLTGEAEKLLLAELIANLEFINANAMHDSITIDGKTEVTKYVFFPRGDIYGVWGYQASRILSIYTDSEFTLSATKIDGQTKISVKSKKLLEEEAEK